MAKEMAKKIRATHQKKLPSKRATNRLASNSQTPPSSPPTQRKENQSVTQSRASRRQPIDTTPLG